MSVDLEALFARLPAYLQRRDAVAGAALRGGLSVPHTLTDAEDYGPLKSLLSVLSREGQIMAEDIAQLYDDQFIETCAPWLIPYIGALVGASQLEDFGEPQSARAWVAGTIAMRQRKGTLAALEMAVRAATGWPVMAVEYWDRVATTHSLRRVRIVDRNDRAITPAQGWAAARASPTGTARNLAGTAQLGSVRAQDGAGTPFDTVPRRAEMGQIAQGSGRWNLPNIGLHLYRVEAVALGSPAVLPGAAGIVPGYLVDAADAGPGHYRFSPYRVDQALFQRPAVTNADPGRRASESDLPLPLTRALLHANPARLCPSSLAIHVTTGGVTTRLAAAAIKAADLSTLPDSGRWSWGPRPGVALVDPELGRFTLPSEMIAGATAVHVYWHYGRTHRIGGHERAGPDVPDHAGTGAIVFPASTVVRLSDLPGVTASGLFRALPLTGAAPRLVAVEGASPTLDLEGMTLRLTAPPGASAMISGLRIVNGRLILSGKDDPTDAIAGHGVTWRIEDCTILDREIKDDASTMAPNAATILVDGGIDLTVARSVIVGRVRLSADAVMTAQDCALQAPRLTDAVITRFSAVEGQTLSLVRCTVLGRVDCFAVGGRGPADTGALDVQGAVPATLGISDSLIVTDVDTTRPGLNITATQDGCVRYSRIPAQSRTPRRYRCLPAPGQDDRVTMPQFASIRFTAPNYLQLTDATPAAVRQGASNGAEMGVGNRMMTAVRLRNLDRATAEFLRFGSVTGPIYET